MNSPGILSFQQGQDLLVERLLYFFQGGYTEELDGFAYVVLYVHLVATLHKLPLLVGQSGPAVKRRVSLPKDAALTRSQNKILTFQICLCPTVPKGTNPKQLLFLPTIFKT